MFPTPHRLPIKKEMQPGPPPKGPPRPGTPRIISPIPPPPIPMEDEEWTAGYSLGAGSHGSGWSQTVNQIMPNPKVFVRDNCKWDLDKNTLGRYEKHWLNTLQREWHPDAALAFLDKITFDPENPGRFATFVILRPAEVLRKRIGLTEFAQERNELPEL